MMKNNVSPQYNPNTEYCVYIHHGKNHALQKWERASKTSDYTLALEQAQMLYHSDKYEKIEIQKVFFCKNKKKKVGETYKIFSKNKSDISGTTNIIITSVTICVGIIVLLINITG